MRKQQAPQLRHHTHIPYFRCPSQTSRRPSAPFSSNFHKSVSYTSRPSAYLQHFPALQPIVHLLAPTFHLRQQLSSFLPFSTTLHLDTTVSLAFHRFVRDKLAKWRRTYVFALTNVTRLHLLHYELLREAPLLHLHELLTFLGQATPSPRRLACLERHLEGVARGAQRPDLPYTPRETKALQGAVKAVDRLARRRGLRGLPDYSRYHN